MARAQSLSGTWLEYKKMMDKERVFDFLYGLNKDFDEIRGRVLGFKPFPEVKEAFAMVWREESRKRFMLGKGKGSNQPDPLQSESAMFTKRHYNQNNGTWTGHRNSRPWCDHCKRLEHTKDTCWEIHSKPPHLKQSDSSWRAKRQRENRGLLTSIEVENGAKNSESGLWFTKDQLEQLKAIFIAPPSTSVQPTASVAQKGHFSSALSAKTETSNF